MAVDRHLQIKAGELGKMSMGIGVLGSEDGPDLEHPLHVGCDAHLLRKLWTLRKVRGSSEVVDFED